jgi:hypothetical protein
MRLQIPGTLIGNKILQNIFVFGFLVFCLSVPVGALARFMRAADFKIAEFKKRLAVLERMPRAIEKSSFEIMKTDSAGALGQIKDLAAQAGVSLKDIKFQRAKEIRGVYSYQALPIELGICGPETAVLQFLFSFKKIGFLCRVVSVYLNADAANEGLVYGRFVLEKIDLRGPVEGWNEARLRDFLRRYQDQEKENKDHVFSGKKLFKASLVQKTKNIQVAAFAGKDILKDLNLVGIIRDPEVKAIIEDKKAAKTYFLNVGDRLNELKVAKILDKEVILDANGAQYTLAL